MDLLHKILKNATHFDMQNIEPKDENYVKFWGIGKKSEVKEGYWDSLLEDINKKMNAR
jgi:hypothetical protein